MGFMMTSLLDMDAAAGSAMPGTWSLRQSERKPPMDDFGQSADEKTLVIAELPEKQLPKRKPTLPTLPMRS